MTKIDFSVPKNYINREISSLEFNLRVLAQAMDKSNPLFERIKFLAIFNSNLDEFYMVRVGSLYDQIDAGYHKTDDSGNTPLERLEKISLRVHQMVASQYVFLNAQLLPKLKKQGFQILAGKALNKKQVAHVKRYFEDIIFPVLTPMAVDASRPFPLIQNKSMNIGVLIENSEADEAPVFSTVEVPRVLPRFLELPDSKEKGRQYILLEDVIKMFIQKLFVGKKILEACIYRIIRNADLSIDEDEAEDLLLEIEKSIKQRKWGQIVRLEMESGTSQNLIEMLKTETEVNDRDVFFIQGPMDLTLFFKIYEISAFDALKYPCFEPQQPAALLGEENIFDAIRKQDILLHHPYASFEPIMHMIREAASDPSVLAIKQTLYRISGDSPIIPALIAAADAGKQVTVLVELKARFDEENNIQWAKQLEKSGCHVIYGLVGLKTHCKITLIVRMEDNGIQRYVHLSTGNYNDITAKVYTDLGLLTNNKYMAEDASSVFNALSGYCEKPNLHKLIMGPYALRKKFLFLIHREMKHALGGKKAEIIVKINSLVDKEIIEALYQAASAGVIIKLIVRGICALRPGMIGLSENIQVRSIVGRFLEHSRLFYFYNNREEEIYSSSADWMERNLERRVELLYPMEDPKIKAELKQILELTWKDNVKTSVLASDGSYKRIATKGLAVSSQDTFMALAMNQSAAYEKENTPALFRPKADA